MSTKPSINTGAVDTIVSEYMEHEHVVGQALALTRAGSPQYVKAYGLADIAENTPVTVHTPFELASCTKTFTAWGILYLQLQGQLSVDDPVEKYVPLTGPGADFGGIALKYFLSMSGALADSGNSLPWSEQLKRAFSKGLQSTPGSTFLYSNPSFNLMGAVIQEVSGCKYPDFMQDKMLAPLNLADTLIHTESNTPADLAKAYQWEQAFEAPTGTWTQPTTRPPSASFSAGACLSSAQGLADYMCALDNQDILSDELYTLMFSKVPLTGGKPGTWGLGWGQTQWNGRTVWVKDGGLPGYCSYFVRDVASQTSVALTNNTSSSSPATLAKAILFEVLSKS